MADTSQPSPLEAATQELEIIRLSEVKENDIVPSSSPVSMPGCDDSSFSSSEDDENKSPPEFPQSNTTSAQHPSNPKVYRRSMSSSPSCFENDSHQMRNGEVTLRTGANRAASVPPSLFDPQFKPRNHQFPAACFKILHTLPGSRKCVDCGEAHPQWASISYGVLLCLQCSGRHRSLGVQVSFVRSLTMDSWSHSQILSMLEGGNAQLTQFFERHSLSPSSPTGVSSSLVQDNHNVIEKRYKMKAAKFYRENLALHVSRIITEGTYKGREEARRRKKPIRRCSTDPAKFASDETNSTKNESIRSES